jgi:hypothetical protein
MSPTGVTTDLITDVDVVSIRFTSNAGDNLGEE